MKIKIKYIVFSILFFSMIRIMFPFVNNKKYIKILAFNTTSSNTISSIKLEKLNILDSNKKEINELNPKNTYTMNATVNTTNGVLYKFWLYDSNKATWTIIQDFSDKNTVTWVPENYGNYRLVVHVKDKNSNNVFDDYKYEDISVVAIKTKLDEIKLDSEVFFLQKNITISASGTSANGILYKFWLYDSNKNAWIVLQDYSEKNTFSWTPQDYGQYKIVVHGKDKLSKNDLDDYKCKNIDVMHPKAKLDDIKSDSEVFNPQKNITFTASGTSANGILYKFWLYDSNNNAWIVLQDYSEKNTFSWTPQVSGQYKIVVHGKDKLSKNDLDDYKCKNIDVIYSKAKLAELMSDSDVFNLQKPNTITASGTSANGILYKFWLYDSNKNAWIVLQDYSEKNSFVWTPQIIGQYKIIVHAKDKLSKNDYDDYKVKNIDIIPAKAKLDEIKSDSDFFYSQKTINLTASGTSANGILYEFWLYDSNKNTWTIIQDYSEKNTFVWTPQISGQYKIVVHAKDKISNNDYDDYKCKTINVMSSKAKLDSFGLDSNYLYVRNSYSLTANATSGNGVMYKFWLYDFNKANWIVLQDYSEKNSIIWTPEALGQYKIVVHARDKYSNAELDDYLFKTINVNDENKPSIEDKANISDFSFIKDGIARDTFLVGQTYNINAKAKSINGSLYEFYVCDMLSGKWTILKNYSEQDTVQWTPQYYSRYEFVVHVKDKNSLSNLEDYKFFYIKPQSNGIINKIIVIDPGHGGIDCGAVSSVATGSIKEKDINLSLSKKIGDKLKSLGAIVFYTSDYINPQKLSDIDSLRNNLKERVDFGDKMDADLFLSIHHDSSTNNAVTGISTHYSTYRPNIEVSGVYTVDDTYYDSTPSEQAVKSTDIASRLLNSLNSLGLTDRGTYDHNLYVTRMNRVSAVLLEAGFMSNDSEVLKVSNPSFEEMMASKISDCLSIYFK